MKRLPDPALEAKHSEINCHDGHLLLADKDPLPNVAETPHHKSTLTPTAQLSLQIWQTLLEQMQSRILCALRSDSVLLVGSDFIIMAGGIELYPLSE
jgi:hypothetical protein